MTNFVDGMITQVDKMLRVVGGVASASRPSPAVHVESGFLTDEQRRHSASLMRVNHVGEVCAQALYSAQSQFAKSEAVRAQFIAARREEEDHLAWTAQRIAELGANPSLLNPVWYAGAYAMGVLAAQLGDARNLGFVVETERQVEMHLASHMIDLPMEDKKSLAIVEQMRADERAHGNAAQALGAQEMPAPLKQLMEFTAKIMTTTAYHL